MGAEGQEIVVDVAKLGRGVLGALGEGPQAEALPRPALDLPGSPTGREASERLILRAIPKFFRGHRLETVGAHVKRQEAVGETRAALADILAGKARVVTFVGRSEAGKTSLAASLVAALDRAQQDGDGQAYRLLRSFVWLDALELSRARSSFKLGDGEAPLVDRARKASLLVLDEVGAETVAGSDEVLDVIWRRWQDERPTIVTTGQPGKKLIDRYGEGVYTRLTKQSASRLIRCSEPQKEPAQQKLPLEGGHPR
jgi:hypothetical protein